ncbi:hypothetical protein FMUAM8_02600 [Nocardia cyriacigeorgica]|nr:hypothetical protein FMUAM8_02600 [Nocardia cyriacigeorgica]
MLKPVARAALSRETGPPVAARRTAAAGLSEIRNSGATTTGRVLRTRAEDRETVRSRVGRDICGFLAEVPTTGRAYTCGVAATRERENSLSRGSRDNTVPA